MCTSVELGNSLLKEYVLVLCTFRPGIKNVHNVRKTRFRLNISLVKIQE